MTDFLRFLLVMTPLVIASHGLCFWLGRRWERSESLDEPQPHQLEGVPTNRAVFLP